MKKLRLLVILSLGFLFTAGAQEIPSYPFKNADNAEGWRIDSLHYYDFDGTVNDSVLFWRDLYTINAYGNKSNIITYVTEVGVSFSPYLKQEFIYDEWQNQISHTYYGWNSVSSTWEAMDRMLKHYHPGDTLIQSTATAVFDGSSWKKQDSIYYSRDALNRIDSTFEFFWSSANNTYEPRRISCKSYNTNNLVQFDTIYTYNNNNWQLLYARDMHYNAAGNITVGNEMKWNESIQLWEVDTRILWSYDAGQNLTLLEVFDWDETSMDWVYDYYMIYTYDNGNLDLMRHFRWNEDLQLIEKGVTIDHFWGFHNFIGLQDLQFSQALKVFPNPAREHVNVYIEEDCELVMLNMSGQQVLSTSLTKGNNNIKLSAYPAGTYLLRTKGSREMASFKLMLR